MSYRSSSYRPGCCRTLLSLLMGAALLIAGIKIGAWKPDILNNAEYTIGKTIANLLDSRPVIAIDAGHGGDDPGATGLVDEAELTAQTAAALFDLLEADGRFQPVLCHEYDTTATIQERYAVANSRYADLLVCIHANSDLNGSGSGFECYPAPPGREYHQQSYDFAQLLVEEFSTHGMTIRGENGIRYAYYDDNNEKYIMESSNTLVFDDPFFGMLEKTKAPAVLVEQCFVSSESDLAQISGESGTTAAECYYRAICRFFAGQLKDASSDSASNDQNEAENTESGSDETTTDQLGYQPIELPDED